MSNKFTLDVNITNVDFFLKGPSASILSRVRQLLTNKQTQQQTSRVETHQGLEWQGQVTVTKPALNPTSGDTADNKTYIACYLNCNPPSAVSGVWSCKGKALCKINLVRLNSNMQNPVHFHIASCEFGKTVRGWGWAKFLAFDDFLKGDYVKDNQALIRIEVDPGIPSGLHIVEKGGISTTSIETRMCRTLSLLHSGKGFNVTFVTKDGKRIKAHSHILMAGSPIIAAMLKEAEKNSRPCSDIQLPDVTSSCLQKVLEYIYGAPLSKLDNIPLSLIKELIPAAHKYELNELKAYCGHLLVERWIPSNLWELFKMTKKYNLEGPKKELEEIVKEHVGEVLDQAASTLFDEDED